MRLQKKHKALVLHGGVCKISIKEVDFAGICESTEQVQNMKKKETGTQ